MFFKHFFFHCRSCTNAIQSAVWQMTDETSSLLLLLQLGIGSDNWRRRRKGVNIFADSRKQQLWTKLQICQRMYEINVLLILENELSIERNGNNISNICCLHCWKWSVWFVIARLIMTVLWNNKCIDDKLTDIKIIEILGEYNVHPQSKSCIHLFTLLLIPAYLWRSFLLFIKRDCTYYTRIARFHQELHIFPYPQQLRQFNWPFKLDRLLHFLCPV